LFPIYKNVLVPCKSSVKVQPKILDIFFLGEFMFVWTKGHVSLHVVNVMWSDSDPFAFVLHLFNHFCIAARLVCSCCEAVAGSLSVASTALSAEKVDIVYLYSGELDRSTVYSRYNNDPWVTCSLTGESSVYLFFSLYEKVPAMQIGF
jgi:hypothetical protein